MREERYEIKEIKILPHDDIVNDCLESQQKEFAGLSSREYLLVLRTLDYVYEKALVKKGE